MADEPVRRTPRRGFLSAGLPHPASGTAAVEDTRAFGVVKKPRELLVRFHDPFSANGINEVELEAWLDYGDIGLAIADHIYDWGTSKETTSIEAKKSTLSAFRAYLDHVAAVCSRNIQLCDLNTDVMNGYIDWLDAGSNQGEQDEELKPWSDLTRAGRWNAARSFINWCRANTPYSSLLPGNITLKVNPWPGRHHTIKPRQTLSYLNLQAVRQACMKEIASTRDALNLGLQTIADPSVHLPRSDEHSVTPYRDLKVRLKAASTYYPSGLPDRTEVKKSHPGLARALTPPYGTFDEIHRHLFLTPRTIVPFVLLTAMDTIFNPDTHLTLDWARVKKTHPVFGATRWEVIGLKPRSRRGPRRNGRVSQEGGQQRRSFAAQVSDPYAPVNLLRDLENFTASCRAFLSPIHKNRVFVFITRHRKFRSYQARGGASNDGAWGKNLRLFIEDNDLPSFSLKDLRKVGSDIVFDLSGGDLKSQQTALGHPSAATTEKYYQSGYVKERRREALARCMQYLDRYFSSRGKIDSRGGRLQGGNNSAATPGFVCVNPEDSPQPGQIRGRLCSAYGACADCPLAFVNRRDPRSFFRLFQLKLLMEDAKSRLDPIRWIEVWRPRLAAIEEIWLPMFTVEAIDSAKSLSLPALPEIE